MFEVEGDSMYPSLRSGDYVVGESVVDCCNIKTGHIYIMVSRAEGIVIKRVTNDPLIPGKLILNSDNEDKKLYKPFVINGPSVLECWELYKVITGPPDPQDPLVTRLSILESEMAELRRSFKKH
jgi:signal peptidase I